MSSFRNSVLTAGAILSVVAALAAGNIVRDRVEVGTGDLPRTGVVRDGLLASTEVLDTAAPVTETDLFYRLIERLKVEYVDPVEDEEKLAVGAVRGMVGVLVDPHAAFYDQAEYQVYLQKQRGEIEGIGAELRMDFDRDAILKLQEEARKAVENPEAAPPGPVEQEGDTSEPTRADLVPRLVVTAVYPGGVAEAAGLKVGDRIDGVNGRWVLSSVGIEEIQEINQRIAQGKVDEQEIGKLRDQIREKTEHGLAPGKALDMLTQGTGTRLEVRFEREGEVQTVSMTTSVLNMPPVQETAEGLRLTLLTDAPQAIRQAIRGKDSVTIDLRQSGMGSFEALKGVMEVLVPAGNYGEIANEKGVRPRPLTLEKGNAKPPKITLLVDSTTRGAAEVLALALSNKGLATLKGTATAGDRVVTETIRLQDGSAYTLPIGVYRVSAPLEVRP